MLIRLRDNKNKLHIKDMLDIDFDMTVKQDGSKYYVQVNRRYRLDETFEKEDDAEERMIFVAECRNQQEEELKNY